MILVQAQRELQFNPADRTDGGIVLFLSVQGPDSDAASNNYGVRLFGSASLPFPNMGADPTGITVLSDQAMYVLGDYNTVAPKQPAAVIGDTVNILSNGWFGGAGSTTNDAQSTVPLATATRVAASTTINAAFIAGVDDTIAGYGQSGYNGGLENYPRFHEEWSGRTFTYRGSFVSLGTPTHANGPWCGTGSSCNIYNPPRRDWNYDFDFGNVAKLPPLTPRFVCVQQVMFTESFR